MDFSKRSIVLRHFLFSPWGSPPTGPTVGSPRKAKAPRSGDWLWGRCASSAAPAPRRVGWLRLAGFGWLWLALAGLLLGFRLDFGLIGLGWLWLRISPGLGFWLSFTMILVGFGLLWLDFCWIWFDFGWIWIGFGWIWLSRKS